MAARRRHKNVNEISSAWNEDEAFDENIENMIKTGTRAKMKLATLNLKLAIGQRRGKLEGNRVGKKTALRIWWISFAIEKQVENRSVFRKQSCNNSFRLACKRLSILCRYSFLLFLCRSLRCNFEKGAIVFVSSPLTTNSHVASVNPEFGTTMARRLNQSRVSAVPVEPNCNKVRHGRSTTSLNWA